MIIIIEIHILQKVEKHIQERFYFVKREIYFTENIFKLFINEPFRMKYNSFEIIPLLITF